jgi:hypothetical protein
MWMVSITIQPPCPQGSSLRNPFYRWVVRLQSRSGHYGEGENLLPLPGIETQLLGRPARSVIAVPTELSRRVAKANDVKTSLGVWTTQVSRNKESGERSRYSYWLQPGRPRSRGSSLGRGKIFLISTSSGPVRGPTQPPMQCVPGGGGAFPQEKSGRGVKLTTHLKLVPWWRMCGFIHPLPHTPSWSSA